MTRLLKTLLVAAALVFFLVLALYAIVSGGNPVNRVGFALFVSLLPAVVTLMIVKLWRLSGTWMQIVLVYVVAFIATILAQTVLRSIG